jgi:hypothetical protein
MNRAPLQSEIASGIHEMDIDAYLAHRDHISSSGLKRILDSPEQLQRYLLRQHESTPRLDLGTAVHCALLEPERFLREYVALPGHTADLFHAHDLALIEAQRGHPVHFITDAQMEVVQGICDQVARLPDIAALLRDGLAERSLFWRDTATGIRCNIRPDLLVMPHLILELKTTFDASLPVFQRTLRLQRYHLSAAMYLEGVRQLTGQSLNYVYLVASRHPPYEVQSLVPDAATLEEGGRLFRQALLRVLAVEELRERYRAAGELAG